MSSTHRISASGAKLEALEAQVLNLSLKYNFVTPLTHMVVTKPEGQEQFQVAEKPEEVGECGVGAQPPLLQTTPLTPAVIDSQRPILAH